MWRTQIHALLNDVSKAPSSSESRATVAGRTLCGPNHVGLPAWSASHAIRA